MKLSKKDFNVLDKHKQLLLVAYRDKTFRDLYPADKTELYNIYLGLGYQRTNISCNSCILSVLTTLYYVWKKYDAEKKKPVTGDKITKTNTDK